MSAGKYINFETLSPEPEPVPAEDRALPTRLAGEASDRHPAASRLSVLLCRRRSTDIHRHPH